MVDEFFEHRIGNVIVDPNRIPMRFAHVKSGRDVVVLRPLLFGIFGVAFQIY